MRAYHPLQRICFLAQAITNWHISMTRLLKCPLAILSQPLIVSTMVFAQAYGLWYNRMHSYHSRMMTRAFTLIWHRADADLQPNMPQRVCAMPSCPQLDCGCSSLGVLHQLHVVTAAPHAGQQKCQRLVYWHNESQLYLAPQPQVVMGYLPTAGTLYSST